VLPSVSVRENVVSIKGLKVGVFTEVLSAEVNGEKIENLSTFQDSESDTFAKAISERFEDLARVHPSFSRLQGLDEMVALTRAIEEMEEKPDLTFWLQEYKAKQVSTTRAVKVLSRKEPYEVSGRRGGGKLSVSGGVQLMAIALRLKAGDVTALREAVIKTRPQVNALSWTFVVGEWLIPTSPGTLSTEEIIPLFTQATFLSEKKRYDEAIVLYEKILELKPDMEEAYNDRGIAYVKQGQYEQALVDFTKAIELDPQLASAYHGRGVAYVKQGHYEQALADYT
jgi:tetratricopeptide (TPR) repeat protein